MDHAARRRRTADRVADLGLDALLVTSLVHVRYLTGFTGSNGALLVGSDAAATFATDFRYYDYRDTNGFRTAAFNPDGSVAGLGWKSVFGLASGVQYQATDCWFLRMGYSYNQNPISNEVAFFNVASPLIQQHLLSIGASRKFRPRM